MRPVVRSFFDPATFTWSHVVRDPASRHCAVIDPVLDFDPASGRVCTRSADAILAYIADERLELDWIVETHVHADHLSGARHIRAAAGGRIAVGAGISAVQEVFGEMFNAEPGFARDGSQFDLLLREGDTIGVGSFELTVMHTPGHTPACITLAGDGVAFVGDTLFHPDYGTARTDFPGGDAAALYRSIRRILALPDDTVLYLCHDYLPAPGTHDARTGYVASTTVAEERAHNVHVRDGVTEAEFVAFRARRDADLAAPRLLLPAVQFNMRGGEFPPPEDNGRRYFKIPVTLPVAVAATRTEAA